MVLHNFFWSRLPYTRLTRVTLRCRLAEVSAQSFLFGCCASCFLLLAGCNQPGTERKTNCTEHRETFALSELTWKNSSFF